MNLQRKKSELTPSANDSLVYCTNERATIDLVAHDSDNAIICIKKQKLRFSNQRHKMTGVRCRRNDSTTNHEKTRKQDAEEIPGFTTQAIHTSQKS